MHRHRWAAPVFTFNEPVPPRNFNEVTGVDPAAILFGFTNVTWRCTRCPGVKVETFTGRAIPE